MPDDTPAPLEDPSRPIGRTAVQAAVPAAVVTIGTWWAVDLAGVDLNGPAPGTEMPTTVTAAFITLATVGMAWAMNRRRGRRPAVEG